MTGIVTNAVTNARNNLITNVGCATLGLYFSYMSLSMSDRAKLA